MTAKQTIYRIADCFSHRPLTSQYGPILEGLTAKPSLDPAFTLEDGEHGLHRCVGKRLARNVLLHRLDVCRPHFPQDLHDFKFEASELLVRFAL